MDGILPAPDLPIRLDVFEGPLDLLLFLIRKNEIDIYDIPIEKVTQQYLEILRTQEKDNLELAGDFFVMAATLMYIKSRMLLPVESRPEEEVTAADEGQDPRWALVQQLIQYKRVKETAAIIRGLVDDRQGLLGRYVIELARGRAGFFVSGQSHPTEKSARIGSQSIDTTRLT